MKSLSTDVGIGSRAHDLHGELAMMYLTPSVETGLMASKIGEDGGNDERRLPPLANLQTVSIYVR